VFSKEQSHWGCKGYNCVDYSLISLEFVKLVFEVYLSESGA
jgi:hypothetical protein